MMATAFAKTLRSIEDSRPTAVLGALAVTAAVFGFLAWWMFRIPVTIHEITPEARLEINVSAVPVQSPLAGKVVRSELALGAAVKAGDILLELDSAPESLLAEQERTKASSVEPEIAALRNEVAAEESARLANQQTSQAAIEEARIRVKEAEAPSRLAEMEKSRLEKLYAEKLIPARELERARIETERAASALAAAKSQIARLEREQSGRDRMSDVRIAELRTRIAKLEGERATSTASLKRVRHDVERRVIRAPSAGRIGDATILRPGSFVAEGSRLASIIPEGQLRIVAQFPPRSAHGRLHTGQRGRLRLDGYPWTEFGVVEALVTQVGAEEKDGRVRVELDVQPSPSLKAPLRHGMPGALEVEVERVTPAALLLRMSGQWITAVDRK